MNIYLLGYMGSGKSTVGKRLAEVINYDFLDLDQYIVLHESMTIPEIFEKKGEIYFRKKETYYLNLLIQEKRIKTIISLGGGTPCYGNNLEIIKKTGDLTIYLNVSFKELTQRLWNGKEERPLVSGIIDYENLEDYVRKHLFERSFFYNQARHSMKVTDQSPEQVVEEIVASLL